MACKNLKVLIYFEWIICTVYTLINEPAVGQFCFSKGFVGNQIEEHHSNSLSSIQSSDHSGRTPFQELSQQAPKLNKIRKGYNKLLCSVDWES